MSEAESVIDAVLRGERVEERLLVKHGLIVHVWEWICLWCETEWKIPVNAKHGKKLSFCPSCGFGDETQRYNRPLYPRGK